MQNFISYSRRQDEPLLEQLEICLQQLSQDNRAAIAIAALYEATEPPAIYFNYNCNRSTSFDKSVALLQELSYDGKLAVTRAMFALRTSLCELAVLKQLQEAIA